MKDYIIVDVDNKTSEDKAKNDEDADEVKMANFKDNIENFFIPKNTDNVYIEMTGNYGLHIILKNDLDLSGIQKNRFT